jgi:predicted deacylase
MHTDTLDLISSAPGVQHRLTVLRFGPADAPRSATIQAALHADEVPAMLVAQQLRLQLAALEAAGQLRGRVQLVPYANPPGLGQLLLGQQQGRFDLRDGANFNRHHVDLGAAVAERLAGALGPDAAANRQLVRQALHQAASALQTHSLVQDLKHKLLQLAISSDVVLDLHCDSEAAMHLYTLTPHVELGQELAALLGARALLLATESGDSPFDEACSRPWLQLAQRFAGHPIPLACFSATVELRGERDTGHALAQQDAAAIIEFLRRRGIVAGTPAPLPTALCAATPLAGSEPVSAPCAGIVVFHVAPGTAVAAGDLVADIVDVDSGAHTAVRARSAGVLYARSGTRWAWPGKRLAKIAGTTLQRTGTLLSP